MIRRSPALAVLLLLLLLPGAGAAQNGDKDLFTVEGVEVDVTADAAANARVQAHRNGQRIAFRRLLERLVPRSSHTALPELGDAGIAQLIESFQIDQERASSVRYIAEMTVHFKPEAVRKLLRDYRIPFAMASSRPVLVLPVYEAGGRVLLWDDVNPWLDAWSRRLSRDGLVPLRVPLGDLQDIATISADQALTGDATRLNAIARRYNAREALVIFARAPGVEEDSLSVTVSRFGGGELRQTTVESFERREGEDRRAFLGRAAGAIAARVEDSWKRENRLDFDRQQALTVTASFAGLGQWLEIRERLARVSMIGRSEVLFLAPDHARLDLTYSGGPERLAQALAGADLVLEQGPTAWELRLSGGATAGPAMR